MNVAEQQLRGKETGRETERRRIDLLKQMTQRLTIIAPVDGVLVEWLPNSLGPGMPVTANTELGRLVGTKNLLVEAFVEDPESLKVGQAVVIEVIKPNAEQPTRVPGKVSFISPVTDAVSGATKIRCEFENPEDSELRIRPGMQAHIRGGSPERN